MPLTEANQLKQISIKKITELFKDTPESGVIQSSLTFTLNDSPTGTMGYSAYYDDSRLYKINLSYTMVDSGVTRNQDINVTTLPCYYGGYRYYFICPDCLNICLKIYLDNTYLKCRKCHHLTYESNNRSHKIRDMNKIFSLLDIYGSTSYINAIKYPIHKGRYTNNYLKAIKKVERAEAIDTNSMFNSFAN